MSQQDGLLWTTSTLITNPRSENQDGFFKLRHYQGSRGVSRLPAVTVPLEAALQAPQAAFDERQVSGLAA